MSVRVGIGYDCHPFAEGRRLVLGGVEIAHERGLAGHSDADERHRDADSLALLGQVVDLVASRGLAIGNVDVTLIVEAPRVAPHRERMRESLAAALGVEAARVSVKATTAEGMGFIGRGEGAAALAVATVDARR